MKTELDSLAAHSLCRRAAEEIAAAGPGLMVGIEPQLSDAELVTLAMVQAVLGFTCEARWLGHDWRLPAALVSPSAPAARLRQVPA